MSISTVLGLIENSLREYWPATAESLQPPVSRQELNAAERALDVLLPTDLSNLYLWHDGANATGATFEVVPTFAFLSLERALETWADLSQRRHPIAGWQNHWLPIGADICDGHLMVETGGDNAGRVFEHSFLDGPLFDQAWDSLHKWADDMLSSITANRLFKGCWRPSSTSPILVWRS